MGILRGLKDEQFNGFTSPPAGWIGRTSTGESVTWDSAMAVGVIFRCVALLGGTVAGMPLITYRSRGETTKRAEDRPEYALLHDAPMPDMTSFIWRESGMGHALMWGNCYSEIIRDDYLGLVGLKLLPPHRVQPKIVKGVRQYEYTQPDGTTLVMSPKEILHIPGLGYDGFVGYSVISLMRDDIGLYRAAHSYGSNYFRNNARPAVVLQHPKAMPTAVQERLAAQMDRLRGSANAGKTIVLEDDMKFATIGSPPEDAQFMQTRQFQVGELSRWFGVPPHMVGDVTGSTSWGAGIAEQSLGFLRFTADSWLNRWEQQLKLQIFGGYPDLHAEFLRESLLKADSLKRFTAYNVAVNTGWMSRAEVRQRENLNPVEGLDEFVLPANIQGIDTNEAGDITNVRMGDNPQRPPGKASDGDDDHYYGAWSGGPASQGGHPVGAAPKPAAKPKPKPEEAAPVVSSNVEAFEKDILAKKPKIEYGQVWDKDGDSVTGIVKGGKTSVRFPADPNSLARWQGGSMTHFHPGDTPGVSTLSEKDVSNLLDHGLASMRAFSQDGSSMTLINKGYGFNGTAYRMHFRAHWAPIEKGFRVRAREIAARGITPQAMAKINAEYYAAYREQSIDSLTAVGQGKLQVVVTP